MTTIEYDLNIRKGILQAGGNMEDINRLTDEDIIAIGIKAAQIGAKSRSEYPRFVIKPINDFEAMIKSDIFDDHDSHLHNGTVRLEEIFAPKKLYVVSFPEIIEATRYNAKLAAEGLRLCVNAPNYLLGFAAQVNKHLMPTELKDKYIVAAEPENRSSVFLDKNGIECFLRIEHHEEKRKLSMTFANNKSFAFQAFLCEDLA